MTGREADLIARSPSPVTVDDLYTALQNAGVVKDDVVIVHASLSRLGWVVGEAPSVLTALLRAVGDRGTVVMPAHTGVSDPATWRDPPVPEHWWPTIREHWPVFDDRLTPLRAMGPVAECLHRHADVQQSGHPATAFMALGPQAAEIVFDHPLEHGLDDRSPLGRLYEADARIVLIGVAHANNTLLHLAEDRATFPKRMQVDGAPLLVDGKRTWVTYSHLDHNSDDFDQLAEAFIASGGQERRVTVGAGHISTCRMRDIVDFGTDWITKHR